MRRDQQAARGRVNDRFRFRVRLERLWWEWLKALSNSRAGRRTSMSRLPVNKADPRKLKNKLGRDRPAKWGFRGPILLKHLHKFRGTLPVKAVPSKGVL
jgi:hypothetical protein